MAIPGVDLSYQVAFNRDPNDPNVVAAWTDLSGRVQEISSAHWGRNYDLDVNETGQMEGVQLRNVDEYLNPANSGSPYLAGLVPYRESVFQAMYPPAGTGNLLPGFRASDGNLIDPTFEAYAAASTPPWLLTFGVATPTVTTSNPQQGTKSLTWATTNTNGTEGVGVTVACIPGRTYTASAYVRQTAANTTLIFINGITNGTNTTTTGAYVRLTVTWTATQPTHEIWVGSFNTTLAGTVNLDAIQHEPGAAAGAFTTSGPKLRNLHRAYIEHWPSSWTKGGIVGLSDVDATDMFAVLANTELGTEVRNAILAKAPAFYWPLDEPSGAATFGEVSGNNGPSLSYYTTNAPANGTISPGNQTNLPGDPSGVGLTAAGMDNSKDVSVIVQTGVAAAQTPAVSMEAALPWSITCAVWHSFTAPTPVGLPKNMIVRLTTVAQGLSLLDVPIHIYTDSSSHIGMDALCADASGTTRVVTGTSAGAFNDGKPHLIVQTTTLTTTTLTTTLWVDNVQVATATFSGTFANAAAKPCFVEVAGSTNKLVGDYAGQNGNYAHLALWSRALDGWELADLDNARKGYPGEGSGARIIRYLGYGWTGPAQIDAGASAMGVSDLGNGTSMLDACQHVAESENGTFYASAGVPTFKGRTDRYLRTTALYVFGGNPGELPYKDIDYEKDAAHTHNEVKVARAGGINAVARDDASRKRFFKRSLARDINIASDSETIDAANWILNTHKDPAQRINSITIDPNANPALWPVILDLEVGMRITVKKRARLANGGAGLTITGDYFIERIDHHGISVKGTWLVTLLLSPASAYQVWILGDAIYGVLDSTTILAY